MNVSPSYMEEKIKSLLINGMNRVFYQNKLTFVCSYYRIMYIEVRLFLQPIIFSTLFNNFWARYLVHIPRPSPQSPPPKQQQNSISTPLDVGLRSSPHLIYIPVPPTPCHHYTELLFQIIPHHSVVVVSFCIIRLLLQANNI